MKHHKVKLTAGTKIRAGDFFKHHKGGYCVVNPDCDIEGETAIQQESDVYRVVPDCFLVRHKNCLDKWPIGGWAYKHVDDVGFRNVNAKDSGVYRLPGTCPRPDVVQGMSLLTFPEDYIGGMPEKSDAEKAWEECKEALVSATTNAYDMFMLGWEAREEAGV